MIRPERMTAAAFRAALPTREATRPWSAATPTDCHQGHHHPSKIEARTCDRLTLLAEATGARLFRQVRFPLLASAPDQDGKPLYMTVDYALVAPDGTLRLLDPKGRNAREWRRGAAALEATLKTKIEIIRR